MEAGRRAPPLAMCGIGGQHHIVIAPTRPKRPWSLATRNHRPDLRGGHPASTPSLPTAINWVFSKRAGARPRCSGRKVTRHIDSRPTNFDIARMSRREQMIEYGLGRTHSYAKLAGATVLPLRFDRARISAHRNPTLAIAGTAQTPTRPAASSWPAVLRGDDRRAQYLCDSMTNHRRVQKEERRSAVVASNDEVAISLVRYRWRPCTRR